MFQFCSRWSFYLLRKFSLLVSTNPILWFIILCWTFWCKSYCILSGILRNISIFVVAMCVEILVQCHCRLPMAMFRFFRCVLSCLGLRPNTRQYYLTSNFRLSTIYFIFISSYFFPRRLSGHWWTLVFAFCAERKRGQDNSVGRTCCLRHGESGLCPKPLDRPRRSCVNFFWIIGDQDCSWGGIRRATIMWKKEATSNESDFKTEKQIEGQELHTQE